METDKKKLMEQLFEKTRVVLFRLFAHQTETGGIVQWEVLSDEKRPKWLNNIIAKYEKKVKTTPKINDTFFETSCRPFEQPIHKATGLDIFFFTLNWSCCIIDKERSKYYICYIVPVELKETLNRIVRDPLKTDSPIFPVLASWDRKKRKANALIIESEKLMRDFIALLFQTQKEERPSYIY